MENASQVLLIVVSSVLSVFLILLIVLAFYAIAVMKRIKEIANRAEHVADSMESAAWAFKKTASPLAILKLISDIVTHTKRKKNKEK